MTEDKEPGYAEWSIIELMGHRRLGGFVREVQVAGAGFFRVDVPGEADGEIHSTQFYPPASVYCLTPVTEPMARAVAKSSRPQPVQRWELPEPAPPAPILNGYCPGCSEWHGGLCRLCGERHPCACGERQAAERQASDGVDVDDAEEAIF